MHDLVGASGTVENKAVISLKPSSNENAPARAQLRSVVLGVAALGDPTPIGAKLDALVPPVTALADADLLKNVTTAKAAIIDLIAARAKMQTSFRFEAGAKAQGMLDALGKALHTTYFSTTSAEADKALEDVRTLRKDIINQLHFVHDWATTITLAKSVTTDLGVLAKSASQACRS